MSEAQPTPTACCRISLVGLPVKFVKEQLGIFFLFSACHKTFDAKFGRADGRSSRHAVLWLDCLCSLYSITTIPDTTDAGMLISPQHMISMLAGLALTSEEAGMGEC